LPESGLAGASYGSGSAPGSSVTYYGNYGHSAGAALGANTTEAQVEIVHRGSDVTLKNLRVSVTTNARAATSSVTTRKNNADTSQVATITASTTGVYTDLTNTVSLTATDKVAYKLVIGSTSGNFTVASITVNHESASQAFNFWSAIGSASTTNASATRYWNVTGDLATPATTETLTHSYLPVAGAISNLRAYVTAARATNTTLKSRVGAADGAMSVTLTASTTGAFEDTTNSDTVAVGDLFNLATVTSTGSDTLTISNLSVRYVPSTAGASAIGAGAISTTLTSAVTRFFAPLGRLAGVATENTTEQLAAFAGSASHMAARVSANASTTSATMVLRQNGADTGLTFAIAGGATGSFVDASNSVSLAAGDLFNIKGSGADGTITFRSLSLRLTEAAGPVTATASITEANDTVSSASTVAIKADAAITEAGDTLSAAAALALKAAVAITEAGDSLSSASRLAIAGALAVTEDGDTLSASTGAVILADLSVTEADDTLSAMSILVSAITGALAVQEADDTLSALSSSVFWQAVSVNSETWTEASATPATWTVQ